MLDRIGNMMRALKKAFGINLALSAVAVFGWTGYALLHRQPMAEAWMGLSREIGGFPMWVDVVIVESIVVGAFFLRQRTVEWRVRLLIAGIGATGLIFSLGLPLLFPGMPDLFPAPAYTVDRVVWSYACISDLAYGLVGTSSADATGQRQGAESRRYDAV